MLICFVFSSFVGVVSLPLCICFFVFLWARCLLLLVPLPMSAVRVVGWASFMLLVWASFVFLRYVIVAVGAASSSRLVILSPLLLRMLHDDTICICFLVILLCFHCFLVYVLPEKMMFCRQNGVWSYCCVFIVAWWYCYVFIVFWCMFLLLSVYLVAFPKKRYFAGKNGGVPTKTHTDHWVFFIFFNIFYIF